MPLFYMGQRVLGDGLIVEVQIFIEFYRILNSGGLVKPESAYIHVTRFSGLNSRSGSDSTIINVLGYKF